MKNKNILLLSVPILLMLSGCESDLIDLDKEPQTMISGNAIFSDENLVLTYLAEIYASTLFLYGDLPTDSRNSGLVNMMFIEAAGAECRNGIPHITATRWPTQVIDENGAGYIDYWPYQNIRFANDFIVNVEMSDFEQDYKDQLVSEARFLRAFMYFRMLQRYGGVPILTEPQDVNAPVEELNVARNTEKEVIDFIADEMNAITLLLPEVTEKGRANKYAALALKSRAMLYAASIAEFDGTQQLNGLLGLTSSEAAAYWQASYDASNAIISSAKYSLYNKLLPDDPVENFTQMYTDESNNPEHIFVRVFDADLNKGHSFSNGAIPFEFRAHFGSEYCPFLETVEEFEYIDGKPGTIDRALIDSDYLFDIDSVFRNRDPRFLSTIFFPESEYQGGIVHIHHRTVVGTETFTGGTIGTDWPAAGPARNNKVTGFMLRKRLDETLIKPDRLDDGTDYVVFRFGEILLNHAEAAFYLGLPGEALNKVNMIRTRAGMPLLTSITEDDIRHERAVELAFEEMKYWDLRRWRTAVTKLDGKIYKGLQYSYYYNEDKYDFHLVNGDIAPRVFQQRNYYLPLGVSRIADNPNLVENPGY